MEADDLEMPRRRRNDGRPLLDQRQTWAWQKVRKVIMARDMWRCQACGANAEHVDHITPRRVGGGDAFDNLQSLCGDCHREKSAAEWPWAGAGQAKLIKKVVPPRPAPPAGPLLPFTPLRGELTKK